MKPKHFPLIPCFLQAQLHSSFPSSSTSSCPWAGRRRGTVGCGRSISAPRCCCSVGSPWAAAPVFPQEMPPALARALPQAALWVCCVPAARDVPHTFPLTPATLLTLFPSLRAASAFSRDVAAWLRAPLTEPSSPQRLGTGTQTQRANIST